MNRHPFFSMRRGASTSRSIARLNSVPLASYLTTFVLGWEGSPASARGQWPDSFLVRSFVKGQLFVHAVARTAGNASPTSMSNGSASSGSEFPRRSRLLRVRSPRFGTGASSCPGPSCHTTALFSAGRKGHACTKCSRTQIFLRRRLLSPLRHTSTALIVALPSATRLP